MVAEMNDFTSVTNDIARNSTLSLTAKGLYLSILWFVDNNIGAMKKERIRKKLADQDDSFEEAWNELKSNGYLWGIDESREADNNLTVPAFLMMDDRFKSMSSDAKILYSVMLGNSAEKDIPGDKNVRYADLSKIKYPFDISFISEIIEYGLAEEYPKNRYIYLLKTVGGEDDDREEE